MLLLRTGTGQQKKPLLPERQQGPKVNSGGDLLSHPILGSTIGAEELNFRVRNGNGCDLFAIATGNHVPVKINKYGFLLYILCYGKCKRDMVKPHVQLVSVSSDCCQPYTSDLSTSCSLRGLQGLTPREI